MATKKSRKSKDLTADVKAPPADTRKSTGAKGTKGRKSKSLIEPAKVEEPTKMPATTRSSKKGRTSKPPAESENKKKSLIESHSGSTISTEPPYYGWEEENMGKPHWLLSESSLDDITSLLNDYKRFKAARVIQTAARRWFTRRMYLKKRKSAMLIQRVWRKFYTYHKEYLELEQLVQDTLWAHYHRSATIIQSLWRGWLVRQYIHDHYRLQRMQKRAAQDLLLCVAFKLHHLLRTRQIPGVYSLRNSECLSQVEKLLASMSFKKHNAMVRFAAKRRERLVGDAKKMFCESVFGTKVPFAGPNFSGICHSQCIALYDEIDADRKMHAILSAYEQIHASGEPTKKLRSARLRHLMDGTKRRRRKKKKPNFCDDIVESMRHWKIIDEQRLTVPSNIFKKPENLENFLTEMQSIFSELHLPCHCSTKINELTECRKHKMF